jgi:hypothetical protein
MAAASNYVENLSLKWLLSANAATRPTAWYVALFTSDPTDAGTGTEVSGGSYARQSASFTITNDVAANSAQLLYPTASSNWGAVSHVGIYDASTGGNLLFHGAASSTKLIETGDA